jgi:hypothetical protein
MVIVFLEKKERKKTLKEKKTCNSKGLKLPKYVG